MSGIAKGTKEFYEARDFFERNANKFLPGYIGALTRDEDPNSPDFYCAGTANQAFCAFMAGYVHGKMNADELEGGAMKWFPIKATPPENEMVWVTGAGPDGRFYADAIFRNGTPFLFDPVADEHCHESAYIDYWALIEPPGEAMTDTEILDWLERNAEMVGFYSSTNEWGINTRDGKVAVSVTLREAVEKAARENGDGS